MRDWKLPWAGRCRCGRVIFEVTAPPMLASACHCTGCQSMTASAYSLSIAVPSDGFKVTEGEPVLGGLQGPQAHHYFCDFCKSWMFSRIDGLEMMVNVRATLLDDHAWFVPFVELCAEDALPWAKTSARYSYETFPPNERFMEMVTEFAEMGAGPDGLPGEPKTKGSRAAPFGN